MPALNSAAIAVPSASPRKPMTRTSMRFRTRFTPMLMTLTIAGVRLSPSE